MFRVGTLNLCLKEPDTLQTDLAQSCADRKPKMLLNIEIIGSTEKWANNYSLFELNPFAVYYKASRDTSLEYPHGVVWNILKINFFKDWPPLLGDP